jgi:hypothetical protein
MSKKSTRKFRKFPGTVCSDVPYNSSEQNEIHPHVAELLERQRISADDPKWHERKESLITATNIAPIVNDSKDIKGVSPYQTKEDLFMKKTGREKTVYEKHTDLSTFLNPKHYGIYFESEAIHSYQLVSGNKVLEQEIGLVIGQCKRTPDVIVHEYIGSTPDGVLKSYDILIEIKVPYKRTIEHKIPEMYIPQLFCQMAVCGIHETHFVQYIPPSDTNFGHVDICVLKFDPSWWVKTLNECEKFWKRVIVFYEIRNQPLGTRQPQKEQRLPIGPKKRKIKNNNIDYKKLSQIENLDDEFNNPTNFNKENPINQTTE